jgi:hypothetical protein
MTDLESRLRTALHAETAELAAPPNLADDMVSRGTKVRRRRRVVGGVAGLVVVAALLPVWKTIDSSSAPVQPARPTPTAVTQVLPTKPTPTMPSPRAAWVAEPITVLHAPKQPPHVIGVRVGRHPTYDRVVLDLDGEMTGYHIATVTRLVQDASGQPVQLPGNRLLSIRLHPADAHDATGSVLFGDTRETFSLPVVRAVALIGDYEGTVTVGVGLSHFTTVRAFELTSPSRLVVDLHH